MKNQKPNLTWMKNCDLEESFKLKIREKGYSEDSIYIGANNVALVKKDNKYILLGCPLCISACKGQNENQEPTLDGQNMIFAPDVYSFKDDVSIQLTSNLWLCPNCFLPDSSLLPQFETNWIERE